MLLTRDQFVEMTGYMVLAWLSIVAVVLMAIHR